MAVAPTDARPRARSLLDLDPDLGFEVVPERLEDARRDVRVRVECLPEGPWQPSFSGGPAALGLLVVSGLLVREVRCGSTCSAELLGPGDIVRPWQPDEDTFVDPEPGWLVAEHAEIAMLDDRVAVALTRWPTVTAAIVARSLRRARGLSVQRAFAQLRRMDERTLLWLWHVAERFGRVRPEGIAVRLPLTHERLAALVGAHRPSLTSALTGLEQSGLLLRDEDHHYVLTPAAAEAVDALTGRAAPAAA